MVLWEIKRVLRVLEDEEAWDKWVLRKGGLSEMNWTER